jgi:hypothetical protein
MTPEEQIMMQQMIGSVRGASPEGAALSTSSISQVADQGQLMQKLAQQSGEAEGLSRYRAMSLMAGEKDRNSAERIAKERNAAISKASGAHKMSGSYITKLKKGMANATLTNMQQAGFQEAYGSSGIPLAGTVRQWTVDNAPAMAPQEWEEQISWWKEFKRTENQLRNDIFGSALTATEKAAWSAATINENMTGEQISKYLGIRQQIANASRAADANVEIKLGRDLDTLQALFNDLPVEFWQDPDGYRDREQALSIDIISTADYGSMSDEDLERIAEGEE